MRFETKRFDLLYREIYAKWVNGRPFTLSIWSAVFVRPKIYLRNKSESRNMTGTVAFAPFEFISLR